MSFFRKLFFKKVAGIRDTYVLEEGDVALDESDGKLYRGDGSTVGGILIQSTAGISLTDISSATTAPSGGGALVYNNSNGQITYTPPDLSGLGGSSLTIQDEGSALSTAATTLNFVGAGVTASGTGATKTITISGGGGGGLSNVVEDTTPQLGGDLDGQAFNITTTGKILYSNLYATEGDLPNATTYHGMFAHVHATGAGYFAHGGAWIKLANDSQLSSYQTTAGLNSAIDTHLNQSGPTSGYVLSWNGSDYAWVANSGGGGGGLSNVVEDTTPQLGGDLDTNGNKITFADSVNAEFGNSGDLKIFHNGGHSIVRETGTGSLYLQSDNNVILSTDSSTKVMVKGIANGATELYHNDILKLNTSTSGVTVVDEVHTEGATPHLTLKRTDNANVPSLRFKGSGGTVGASIEFDGTAGTSNELAFKTFDGASLAERFRVTYTGATITGTLNGHTIPGGTGTLALTSDITSASTAADDLTAGDAAVSIETTTGNITIDAQGTDTDIIFKGTDSGLDTTFLTMKGSTSTIEVHPDANFKLVSGADPNKGVKFATSGSANTTVTFGSASGTVIIHNANQTLTNKTINVDNNTVSNIEVDNLKSGVLDTDLSSVSGSDDTLASAKAIKAYVDANAGISNVVEDTSPQLGGNLDVNGNGLISIGEIDITAGGVVDINANAGNVDISAVGGNVTLSGDTSDMTFTNTGTGIFSFTGDIKAKASTGADLTLQTSATTLSASDVVGKIDFQAPDDSAGSSALLVSGGITLEANGASTSSKQYNKMVFRNSNSSSINQTAMTLEQNGSLTILGDLHSTGASGNQFDIKNTVNNGSMHFQGVDNGVDISALSLNFAESGRAVFNGTAYFNNGVVESFATLTGATGTVVHDCNNGHIFLHTTPAANWTANFTNLDLLQEYRTTLEIMIVQGNTAYMPTAVQIGGVAQTVIYKGNNAPTGTDNGHNRVFFHIFNDGGTYRVYGDHDTYGGV